MPKPEEYKAIAAWGRYMQSYNYYIKNQQELATEENAPIDAIYKSRSDNRWITLSEIQNESLKLELQKVLSQS